MKIFNQQTNLKNSYEAHYNFKKLSFKAIPHTTIKQAKNLANTPSSKEILIKLAGLVGLSSLIAWVSSLTSDCNYTDMEKLNIINDDWTKKGEDLLLNPEKQGEYLDFISKSDSTEALLWTQGLLSKDEDEFISKKISQTEKDIFLELESNDLYLSNSAKNAIKTITSQVQSLINAPEEIKNKAIKSIDAKLSFLVKQAENLQNSENSAQIYSKVANIVKMFLITNLVNSKEEKIDSPKIETIINKEKEEEISEQGPKIVLTPVGKINVDDIDPQGARRRRIYKSKQEALKETTIEDSSKADTKADIKTQTKKQIEINDLNRAFVTEIFLPFFKDSAAIDPELYSSHINLIQKIYENYNNEAVKVSFLNSLKFADKTPLLDLYSKIANVNEDKIQFVNFAKLEQIKNENNSSLTKEEYDTLQSYYGNEVKYIEIYIDTPEKYEKQQTKKSYIRVNFTEKVSAKKRLEIVSTFHKIIYNITEDQLISGDSVEKVTTEDLKKELVQKLANYFKAEKNQQITKKPYLPGSYENILSFLRIDIDDLRIDYEKEAKAGLEFAFEEQFKKYSYGKELLDLLNNEKFANFIVTTHARMRFIERFIFDNNNWKEKTPKALKAITTRAINKLENSIENSAYLQFINYCTDKYLPIQEAKFGARINFFNDTIIGLDESGHIHTMF